tara:strand:+ start:5833 stop:10758 length:4926 start_codon:yes stop_codon:yes gene_type:complete
MVEKVDPVLGLRDSSQIQRWEEAIRNPKGFIASQAPFDSSESVPEVKEEEEKPNVPPSMVKVTETRTGERRVIPPRALSPETPPEERRGWSQPTYYSEGVSPQQALFTPISTGDYDLFGNAQDRDVQGKQVRPDVKLLDVPYQPLQAGALGVKMGFEFPFDIATKWIWQTLYTGVGAYEELMNAPLNLFKYYTDTPLSPRESKSLEKIANRWDQYNKETIPMLIESYGKKGFLSPIKLLSDVSNVPVHKRHASFTPLSFGLSGALPFGGVWATSHKAKKFLDGVFRGAAVYSQLRKPVVASGLGLRTGDDIFPFGAASSEARLNMLTAARLAFEEARQFRPKLPGVEQITTYSQLAQNNKFVINPDLEKALNARSAINLILQKRKYIPGYTYEQARKMSTRNYNNAWLGLGMGAGHAIASQFTDNEMTQMLFGMMAGIPIGKGKIRTDKEDGKYGTSLGRHGVKARKANIALRTLRGASTISGQLGLLALSKAVPVKFWQTLKGDPEEFLKILTRKDHNPVAKTLIAMNFGFSLPQIAKTTRESMKTTRYAVRKHRILEGEVKKAEVEIENINKSIRDTGKAGTDVHKKLISQANAKLETAQKEFKHFKNEKIKQKVLKLNKEGEIEGNPLHLVDDLLMAPSGKMEAVTAMVNAMKTTSKDFEETLGLTLKSLSDISKHTGLDMDGISLTIGQAANAIVFSQYIESSLNAVRVSLMDNGFRLDKTLLGLLDNEIAAHQENLAKSVEALGKSLDTITLSGKDIPKEVNDFIQTLNGIKKYYGENLQTIFESNRKRMMGISDETMKAQLYRSSKKYEEESQDWFNSSTLDDIRIINDSIFDNNFKTFKKDADKLYGDATYALNNFKDVNGNKYAFSVSFNPVSVFRKSNLLDNDQRQIFKSLFEGQVLKEYGSINIKPVNLAQEMRLNAILDGKLENATNVPHFRRVKQKILDPYVDELVEIERKKIEGAGGQFNEKKYREETFDFFPNKDSSGKGIFDQKAIDSMLKFLISRKIDETALAQSFIPQSMPIDTLIKLKRKKTNEAHIVSNVEKMDQNQYNQLEQLKKEINLLDKAITDSIEGIKDPELAGTVKDALGKLNKANDFYANNANHFYGGKATVLGREINTFNSPLHRAWRSLSPSVKSDTNPATFIKFFVNSTNPELAKHQFDMLASIPKKVGDNRPDDVVSYNPEIVSDMIKSLGRIDEATDISMFTKWFDEIVENTEGIDDVKKHYSNWKNYNNDKFKLATDNPARIIDKTDEAEVRLTLDYINKLEESFIEIYDVGGLGQLGKIRNEDELAKAILEKHIIPSQSVEQVKAKLPSGYAEKLFTETNRSVSRELTDAVEKAAQFASSDYKISRLDLLLITLQEGRAAKRISEEKYTKTIDFLQRAVATRLYNNALRKTTTKRLQVKADELNQHRRDYLNKDKAAEDGYVRKYEDTADMEKWLRKTRNFTDQDFTNRVDLSDAFDTTFYSSFLTENKQALNMLFESKPENLKFIEDIFQVSLALDPVSGQAMVSALAGGRYTEQMAAGRLYNAMKGVVSYRYLLMEAGFMKAAAIQQGMVADILADPNLAESVHKMFHLGIFEDKTFDIIWIHILGRLGRMGLTHTVLDYDEVKEEFEKQSEQAAEFNDIVRLTSI